VARGRAARRVRVAAELAAAKVAPFPQWFTQFLNDRQTRKPSAHTMKASARTSSRSRSWVLPLGLGKLYACHPAPRPVRHAGPSEHLFCDIGIWHEVLTVSLHEVLERDGGTPCQALDIVCHQVGVVVAQRDALG
jgi:hypothetical protein